MTHKARFSLRAWPGVVAALVLASCDLFSSDDPEPVVLPDPVPRVVADSLFTVLPSGLKYVDLVIGQGAATERGDTVVVDYNAWLSDSTLIDSSILRGGPVTAFLVSGRVIAGWIEGLEGIRPDGERQLVIPPALAYGETGNGIVPANATLIFEVKRIF
jgi:peptidylprolyl isomerase